MMFLILGIGVGAFAVVFAMENSALVTVSMLSWHFDAPLAMMLLASMVFGIFITLLSMVPQAVRQALDAYAARREARRAEALALATASAPAYTTESTIL